MKNLTGSRGSMAIHRSLFALAILVLLPGTTLAHDVTPGDAGCHQCLEDIFPPAGSADKH
jgi:hypothetical protein